MPKIRIIEIANFRGIRHLVWCPSPGINCLIGPGDSGKSSVLDAIDYCLGARRSLPITDADFYDLDVEKPIEIAMTFGDLEESLKNIEGYGTFLRGFNATTCEVEDEPAAGLETVLTVSLLIGSDLEPIWSLFSDRGKAQNVVRNLPWSERQRIAPTRIGSLAETNLCWRRGSVLNRLTDERADTSAALAKAARDARLTFGSEAEVQLNQTLELVTNTATNLGIDLGSSARALLDAHSVSFGGGTISLHNEQGVPLRNLGIGSARLLVAGLQRAAADQASVLLVDELELGLEPHRVIRFLGSLGAKEEAPPLQVFLTSHSPVAVRELSGSQLFILRRDGGRHQALPVGIEDDVQGTVRRYPEALLAQSVIVCEGASEVGLLRGMDLYRALQGEPTMASRGCAFIDGNGVGNLVSRARALQKLGYRVGILRDDDRQPDPDEEQDFQDRGGLVFKWGPGSAIEDALFRNLSPIAVGQLVDKAIEEWDEKYIDDRIRTASQNSSNLADVQFDISIIGPTAETRQLLAKASRAKDNSWFKNVTAMEEVGRDIVMPDIESAGAEVRSVIEAVLLWSGNDTD